MIYLLFLILVLLALVLIGVGVTLQDVQDLKKPRSQDARPTITITFSYLDRRMGARRTMQNIKMSFMPTKGDFIYMQGVLEVPDGTYIVTSCHHWVEQGEYHVLTERQEID